MFKKYFIIVCFVITAGLARAQDTARHDSIAVSAIDDMAIDTSIDYDELMNDLDMFLDSILAPHSYFLVNLSVGQGYFNFTDRTNTRIKPTQKFVWSPTLGYYNKAGFGFTLNGSMVRDSVRLKFYQLSFSPSYDYLKSRKLAAGISYIRYFTKDSLPFYTSPLQNEVNAYFLWRKSWLKPGIAASYGWGSRSEYTKRQKFIERLLKRAVVVTNTQESIADFSLTFSLRHDFYWLNIFSKKDNIRFSPQLSFAGGSQKFGFNQTSGTYGANTENVLYSAGSVNLDEEMKFQPLSLTLYLRAEYSVGKFYMQPQLLFDYYFPGEDKKFTTLFSLNLGLMF